MYSDKVYSAYEENDFSKKSQFHKLFQVGFSVPLKQE